MDDFYRKTLEGILAWLEKLYYPSHLRLGSWVVGIMLGYVMFQTRGTRFAINKYLDGFLWVASFSVLLCIILGYFPFQQMEDNTTTIFGNALYNTCSRVLWSYAVAWIIFACQNGSGGVVRWFLSLRQWQPLSRMGLSVYLVHRMYQFVTTFSQKQPIYWDFFTQVQKFWSDVLVSILLGAILYLAVENPVLVIENYVHKSIAKRSKSSDRE